MFDYRAKVDRVIDGDTVDIRIDLGFDVWYHDAIRLKGINAPEPIGATKDDGLKAKARLEALLAGGPVIVQTEYRKDKDKDKYGRVLGTLFVNGVNLNQQLLTEGLVKPYG